MDLDEIKFQFQKTKKPFMYRISVGDLSLKKLFYAREYAGKDLANIEELYQSFFGKENIDILDVLWCLKEVCFFISRNI